MYKTKHLSGIKTEIEVPPDKSISHRAVFISSIAGGKTVINNFLDSDDTTASLECMRKLGVRIRKYSNNKIIVYSNGKYFSPKRKVILDARQSGTTLRLISGILSGQNFKSVITAGGSLKRRPMRRITEPLRLMGADIKGEQSGDNEYPPLSINPSSLIKGIDYKLKVSSAQVKSAVIFASLFARGPTKIKEPDVSRDHTERMLKFFGSGIMKKNGFIYSEKSPLKSPGSIFIPGDLSSASFFAALGVLLDNSEITIKNTGINPTRTGFIKVLKRMGARIKITNKTSYFEPYADIVVSSSELKSTVVRKEEVPLMIDEMPILFVCASFAKGKSIIYGLKELKVKESDRILSMVYNLRRAGVDIKDEYYRSDWRVIIKGVGGDKNGIKPADFKSFSDHRTAMSMIIFSIVSSKECAIDNTRCINKSFPGFIKIINSLSAKKPVH